MATKLTIHLGVLLTAVVCMTFFDQTDAQGFFKKLKDKVNQKIDSSLNKKVDNVLNAPLKKDKAITPTEAPANNTNGASSTVATESSPGGRPKLSALHDEDFTQHTSNPPRSESNTRFRIAKNLLIDIKGKYPVGYAPRWRFISYSSPLSVDVENWYHPSSRATHQNYAISIGEYNNKAVVRLHPFMSCECFADIVVKDSFTVLTDQPQTFQLTNFRKILNDRSTGEPCRGNGNNPIVEGGFEGRLTLAANGNGDIALQFMLENYTAETKRRGKYNNAVRDYDYTIVPSQVSYRYVANNITVENEMSAEKANGIIAAELEAKQKYADYVKKSQAQIEELMKVIKTKYPGFNCITCFSRTSSYGVQPTTTQTLWSNGAVTEDHDWNVTNTMRIENKCDQELTFIGIQQLYDNENGYYYKDVTRKMEAKYFYQAQQGLFMSIFTSLAGIDGDVVVQPEYNISAARVNAIQWIRVIGSKKPTGAK